MSTTEVSDVNPVNVDTRLEVVVLPVSDVDRAKDFYVGLGWRVDADRAVSEAFRIVQLTPPGSECSVQFGLGLTSAAPGSAQNLYLVVSDAAAAREQLIARGAAVSELFHEGAPGDRFHAEGRLVGAAPARATYGTFASFSDPDGNSWLLQEITSRLPGRVDAATTTFASVGDLAGALRRAAAAHGEHEKRIGQADENWPDWYAAYMVAEAGGRSCPRSELTRQRLAEVARPMARSCALRSPTGIALIAATVLASGVASYDAYVVNVAVPAIDRHFGAEPGRDPVDADELPARGCCAAARRRRARRSLRPAARARRSASA